MNSHFPSVGAGVEHFADGAQNVMKWDTGLAPDFKRAGSEVYRSMRQRGHSSVRDYLAQNFNGDRTSGTWSDLWTLAVQLDYSIASAHRMGGDEGVFRSLASSDECEIGLRRLAAFIFEDRTHDAVAARIIQGSAPPGAKVDIASTWLVSDASNLLGSEAKRQQQVNSLLSRKGDKGSKGSGKGAPRAPIAPDTSARQGRVATRGPRPNLQDGPGEPCLPQIFTQQLPSWRVRVTMICASCLFRQFSRWLSAIAAAVGSDTDKNVTLKFAASQTNHLIVSMPLLRAKLSSSTPLAAG